jgi:hypothetical protein
MKDAIEAASKAAGRHPEMILAGHVHDYQRVTRVMKDGTEQPEIVTGAGGYYHLHNIMKVNGQHMSPPVTFKDKANETLRLEKYCDDHHGFLRVEVTDKKITGRYFVVPRPHESFSKPNQLVDYWEFDWRAHKWLPNAL